jgi:MinD superfamily P-loop ATPase
VNFNPLLNGAELEENLELPMFNIYAGGQEVSQIVRNIELAIDVAASSSGFSCEYINQENPFILFFTLKEGDQESAMIIREVIQEVENQNYPLALVYAGADTN